MLVKLSDIITLSLMVVYHLIAIGECGLYREWKAKLSVQALSHFADPAEVFRTTSISLMVFFFGSTLLLSLGYVLFYKNSYGLRK